MEPTEASSGAGPTPVRTRDWLLTGRRWVRRLSSKRSLLVILLIGGTTSLLWARCGIRGCPPVERLTAYQPGRAPVLLDRNGEQFASLTPVERRMVALEALPDHVPAAFLAVEDRRFFRHRGIDWIRVGGAALANIRAGRAIQGSSTITMQLARNVFADRIPARERTFRRKLLEARVARRIEKRFTKEEILELYLNHIYFGNGAYGIEAAARHYFDRSASKLTVEQAALLAALPKAPTHYNPRKHATRARERRDLVLALMERQGMLESEDAERARARPVRVARATDARRAAVPRAPYFVQSAREALEDRFGEDLWTTPMVVHTTLDPAAQRALEEELEEQIRRVESGGFGRFDGPRRSGFDPSSGTTEYLQGAAVALDPESGDVRAIVGGRDWSHSRFNRAVQARRQVGSAFKPFVFAAALSEEWSPSDWLDDSPYRLASRGGRTWEPENFDGRFMGPITVREALVLSRNVPTVRLAEAVGVKDVARVARESGLSGDMPGTPVIALGVTEASPLELAAAYAVFINSGETTSPRLITRVETPDGEVLWDPESPRRKRVFHPDVAQGITTLLRDAVDHGTGRAVRSAGYRGPAAGKTGTTNDGADAWFVGYTPGLVAAVWVGFDRARPIAQRVSGGTVAAEIWGRTMRRIANGGGGWPERVSPEEPDEDRREPPRFEADRRHERIARGARRWDEELRRRLERLGRERAEVVSEMREQLEDALEDLPVERSARRELEGLLDELSRELERLERNSELEGLEQLAEELLRAIPGWLSENGRDVIVAPGRNR